MNFLTFTAVSVNEIKYSPFLKVRLPDGLIISIRSRSAVEASDVYSYRSLINCLSCLQKSSTASSSFPCSSPACSGTGSWALNRFSSRMSSRGVAGVTISMSLSGSASISVSAPCLKSS